MVKYVELSAPIGKAWLMILEGTVEHHQSQRWSETRVQSRGGGGYVNPTYGGYISPPTITSTVTQHERTEFWVQDTDGRQQRFSFKHDQFPVAPGHKVRIVWGGSTKNKDNGSYLFANNFTSGHCQYFESNDLSSWAFSHGLIKYPLLYVLITFWSPLLIWGYLLFVFIPLTKFIPGNTPIPKSLVAFIRLNLHYIHHWSLSLLIEFFTDWKYWLIFILGVIGFLLTLFVFELVSYSLFGHRWQRKVLEPFRNRVVQVYNMPL